MSLFILISVVIENVYLYNLFDVGIDNLFYSNDYFYLLLIVSYNYVCYITLKCYIVILLRYMPYIYLRFDSKDVILAVVLRLMV